MKPFKTKIEDNFVELYKNTVLNEMENVVFEDIPLFINGIKVTQTGYDSTYLIIYQEIASNVVVIDIYNEDDSLFRQDKVIYDEKEKVWKGMLDSKN